MYKSTTQEDLLSILMGSDIGMILELFDKVRSEWFPDQFHKHLITAIGNCLNKGVHPNVLTITDEFRELNLNPSKYAARISKISGAQFYHKVIVIDAIIEDVRNQYYKLQVSNLTKRLIVSLQEDVFTVDKCLTDMETVKDVLSNKELITESNSQVIDQILTDHDKAHEGQIEGLELGFSNLKQHILIESVDMMVIGARPAMGKTAFAISIICNLVFNQGLTIAFFSLEMSKKQIIRRIIALLTGIDSNKIKYGNLTANERKIVESLKSRPEMDKIIIHDGSHTANEVRRKVTIMKHSIGINLVIIDYLQKLKGDKRLSKYELVSASSNGIKEMSQDLLIPSIALAQLKRDTRKLKERPSLPDLKESGEIENDASIVAFLHRPEYYGLSEFGNGDNAKGMGELLIAKNREGALGEFRFNVNLSTSKWTPGSQKGSDKKEDDDVPF